MVPDITICMSYFRRADLLRRTLLSVQCQNTEKAIEVVIVNDDVTSSELLTVCRQFINRPPFMNIRVFSTNRTYRYRNQNWAMNCAIQRASAKYLIIQNPECFHVGNVIDGLWSQLVASQVDPFYCVKTLSLTPDDNIWLSQREPEWLQRLDVLTSEFAGRSEFVGRNNPRLLCFCLGSTAAAIGKIGGFDEDIKEIGYDDDLLAFHAQVNHFDCRILDLADYYVLHQDHQKDNQIDPGAVSAVQQSRSAYTHIVSETQAGIRPPIANPGRIWGQISDSQEDMI